MEPSVTPWRVLDAEAEPLLREAAHASAATHAGTPSWRTLPVVTGLTAAAILGIVAVGIVIAGPAPSAVVQTGADPVADTTDPAAPGTVDVTGGDLVVHVAGAVRRPGLVHLPRGARVADAIEAAGGLGPRVDAVRLGVEVNLAAPVADGERVVVPSRDDQAAAPTLPPGQGGGGTGGSSGSSGPVDLNHASASELEALPGIGEVTAARIVEARDERPFRSLDELVERKVVGPATLAKFRDLVVLR